MSKPLMQVVLPRLARPLYRHLERLQNGELDEPAFTAKIEAMLQRQHAWLSRRGIAATRAAIALHAAILVLSMPGLRAEADEQGLPLEVLETRALQEAALDIAQSYGMPIRLAADAVARLVAKHSE
ncbi:MAG: hypothetical protein NZO58_13760 [Gemmataceae bacterium]|nr:hypothetical protein [Gemmataceae bacterium]